MRQPKVIPLLTGNAGHCLTMQNWQEIGVESISYSLPDLLVKPGMDVLMSLGSLSVYVGRGRNIIINASMMRAGRDGLYSVRSEFDGRIARYTADDLLKVIVRLQPDSILLPQDFQESCLIKIPDTILPFFPLDEFIGGVNIRNVWVCATADKEVIERAVQNGHDVCIVGDDIDLYKLRNLKHLSGVATIVTCRPALDAVNGDVYTTDGILSITSSVFTLDCGVIDSTCQCLSCVGGLTKAYFHHLFEHTPLLCQRLLIQHNFFSTFSLRLGNSNHTL